MLIGGLENKEKDERANRGILIYLQPLSHRLESSKFKVQSFRLEFGNLKIDFFKRRSRLSRGVA